MARQAGDNIITANQGHSEYPVLHMAFAINTD